jgi:acetoin utilization deacetylase AcuC-like enzyme
MSTYRSQIKKVAIIDFDVHHGNGTQEIIECMQEPQEFREQSHTSILFDNDPRKSTQYRPWLDIDDGKNVLF